MSAAPRGDPPAWLPAGLQAPGRSRPKSRVRFAAMAEEDTEAPRPEPPPLDVGRPDLRRRRPRRRQRRARGAAHGPALRRRPWLAPQRPSVAAAGRGGRHVRPARAAGAPLVVGGAAGASAQVPRGVTPRCWSGRRSTSSIPARRRRPDPRAVPRKADRDEPGDPASAPSSSTTGATRPGGSLAFVLTCLVSAVGWKEPPRAGWLLHAIGLLALLVVGSAALAVVAQLPLLRRFPPGWTRAHGGSRSCAPDSRRTTGGASW